MLQLKFDIKFQDLYDNVNLKKVDIAFLQYLLQADPDLYHTLSIARANPTQLARKAESELILALSATLENFIAELFQITNDLNILRQKHTELYPLYECKRNFIQRKALKSGLVKPFSSPKIPNIDPLDELSFAIFVLNAEKDNNEEHLDLAMQYAIWALHTEEGKHKHKDGILFKAPKKLDNANLLDITKHNDSITAPKEELKPRSGFSYHDTDITLKNALDQTKYCIFCHNQEKDSCSHGMKEKAEDKFQTNALGIKLTGCPLDEKISEMNALKHEGLPIAALAAAVIENPMIAATGHRICNDCMKSCIYQKQEPVNIPLIESSVLKDVLSLPWGFEIYSLLTRWNPLNFANFLPKPYKNHKILVVGLGPAGFTLSHYLLNEGYIVVAIDGLKIEPLPANISGIDITGARHDFEPIKDIDSIFQDLAKRKAYGFGGVAEYGITVRWDKNLLNVIRLLLERRRHFRMYGGTRFGSNITYTSALKHGFDHIALALGAGRPNLPSIPNALAKGVRTASDFLMSLQSTGAARMESLANLVLRLPVVVIGGGLTAIDTATESLAYYPIQVAKYLKNYKNLGENFFEGLNEAEKALASEFIEHAIELEKTSNASEKLALLQQWGGVTVAYRKSIQDSPSYRLNHEELRKALAEGISFMENIVPTEIIVNEMIECIGVRHNNGVIKANSVFMAIGTEPNTILSQEDEENFTLDGKYFQALDDNGNLIQPELSAKPSDPGMFTIKNRVSFFGDLHPSYKGNVVKAMASAKAGYKKISAVLQKNEPHNHLNNIEFFKFLDHNLLAIVQKVQEIAPNILEIVVNAKFAAQHFQPGQFFKLQSYEEQGFMEGVALTGSNVNVETGDISLIVLMIGASSDFCKMLKQGEYVIMMGPTGTPTEICNNKNILLIGGGLGNAVLFSIGKALRNANSNVKYIAGYRKAEDRYKISEIEAAADRVIWCCDDAVLAASRPLDQSVEGNIIEGLKCVDLSGIDMAIIIGSDGMMNAATDYLVENASADLQIIASVNSPMQCMMKEICGQCIQRHVDQDTGIESYVYSCNRQDQNARCVDFQHLRMRLSQNTLQEKISRKVSCDSVI